VNILVDTSIWSLALRRKTQDLSAPEKHLVVELAELIKEGRTRILGVVRQELLSGIKFQDQFERLRKILRSFPDEALETSDYEAAAQASNEIRSKGIAVSVVDALICAVGSHRGWTIFTSDPDFKNYSNVLDIELHTPRY
jgi:predicted nucleic acid-binding protein